MIELINKGNAYSAETEDGLTNKTFLLQQTSMLNIIHHSMHDMFSEASAALVRYDGNLFLK